VIQNFRLDFSHHTARTPFGPFQCFQFFITTPTEYRPISKPQSPPRFSCFSSPVLHPEMASSLSLSQSFSNFSSLPHQSYQSKPPALLAHATQNPFHLHTQSRKRQTHLHQSPLRSNPHAIRPQEACRRQGRGLCQAQHGPRPRHRIHHRLRCRQARPPPPDRSAIQHRRNSHLETHRGASPPTGYPSLGPRRPPAPSPV
jgi:hypothetical protein